MYSGRGNTPSRVLGFPIRTSADQHLVDSSPQLFAVTHVLHRFLAPRHPPLALCSLEEQRCSCLLCSSQRASPASGSCEHAHRTRRGSGAEHSCRARGATTRADSLKTEEKTKFLDQSVKEDGSSTSRSSRLNPPMHQLGTGSNRTGHALAVSERYADQRLNSSSLERR